jgi:hypothetical protein
VAKAPTSALALASMIGGCGSGEAGTRALLGPRRLSKYGNL